MAPALVFPRFHEAATHDPYDLPLLCSKGLACQNFFSRDLLEHLLARKTPGTVEDGSEASVDLSAFSLRQVAKLFDDVTLPNLGLKGRLIQTCSPPITTDLDMVAAFRVAWEAMIRDPKAAIAWKKPLITVGVDVDWIDYQTPSRWWTGLLDDTRVFLAVGEQTANFPHVDGAIIVSDSPAKLWAVACANGPALCSLLGGLEQEARKW